jgi:predicted lipoprotein with Yx(FWY)xxD motif
MNRRAFGSVQKVMHSSQRLGADPIQLGLRVVGAGLLIATGAIHLDLYVTGYKNIPTIGPLFLLQVIAAFGLGLLVLIRGGRIAAALGAGFAAATLGGYLLSIWFGLFGFTEVRTTAGIIAGIIEVVTFAVLGILALAPAAGPAAKPVKGDGEAGGGTLMDRLQAGVPGAGRIVGGLAVLAAVLLGVAVAGAGAGTAATGSSGQTLKTTSIHGVTVLTNAKGLTLYWFAPDTSTKSVCNGSCAAYWPPVPGHVSLAPGVAGTLGTITRSDGSSQATYNGHPLYTYVSDHSPGQASGNNLNINGGLWHEVTVG